MKRVIINLKYIAKLATHWTSGIFALLGLVCTFVSLSDMLNSELPFGRRLLMSGIILISVWMVSFIGCAIYISIRRRYEIMELNGGHHVYVQYGDLFSKKEVQDPQKRRNIVVATNRCFDTLIDNDLIATDSLHGVAMKKLYAAGVFNERTLYTKIQQNLALQQLQAETLDRSVKRKGNLERYPVGSVAEVKVNDTCSYFFLGLTVLDHELKASVSDQDYVTALMKLLKFCNTRSQQLPVVIPLIGGGLARTGKDERQILEFIIQFIKFHKDLINCDIHIVVRESGKNRISITNL